MDSPEADDSINIAYNPDLDFTVGTAELEPQST
jgi:hypothetical protein